MGLLKKQTAVLEPTVSQNRPEPANLVETNFSLDEYVETARNIGMLDNLSLGHAMLCDFLYREGMSVYKNSDVFAYMNKIAGGNSKWDWYALRDVDKKNPNGNYIHDRYQKPVPLSALQKVEKLVKGLPDLDLRFIVTDYTADHPDPFLAVCVKPWGQIIVIDCWDEPDFK